MRIALFYFTIIYFSSIQGLMIVILTGFTHCLLILGQTTQSSNYVCSGNGNSVQFTLSTSSHSAWNPLSSCSVTQCAMNSSGNSTCQSSLTPCFQYRMFNNMSVCAPAVECSILEACNNVTYNCSSRTSVCIVNSCCSPQTVCLPLSSIEYCRRGNICEKLIYTDIAVNYC